MSDGKKITVDKENRLFLDQGCGYVFGNLKLCLYVFALVSSGRTYIEDILQPQECIG